MWKTIFSLASASCIFVSLTAEARQTKVIALNRTDLTESIPTVVQNRFFTKKLRAEAGASFGSLINESYSQTQSVGGRLGLFLSETVGLEYNFSKFISKDSADLISLRTQEICISQECRSIEPSFIRLKKMHQGQAIWAPVYGKINLLDSMIIYSDLTFGAGIAFVETSQGGKWAFTPGIGQRFYFSKSMSLRIDVTDVLLKESSSAGAVRRENWRHNWAAQAGLSVFLNSWEQ